MKYNNAVAGYNQTNIGLKHGKFPRELFLCPPAKCYNQTNIGLKHISLVMLKHCLIYLCYNQTNIGLKLSDSVIKS